MMSLRQPDALRDRPERDRFVNETEANFSVIAPAGVGKTRAIVDRLVKIAVQDEHRDKPLLPRMVVVTYTRKAAGEMRLRTRNSLIDSKLVGADTVGRLNRAFFGTIHSFCLDLLRRHGHVLGLPPTVELLENDAALWTEFIHRTDSFLSALPEGDMRDRFLRLCPLNRILELGRSFRLGIDWPAPRSYIEFPSLDFTQVFAFEPGKRVRDSVHERKVALRRWIRELESGSGFLALPSCARGGKEFMRLWNDSFQPIRDWLADMALALSAGVARQYREFRIGKGRLVFDDVLDLAAALLRHPEAGPRIRAEKLRILLDEAQDTDPRQFEVLTEVARPVHAAGVWMETGHNPPEPGRFCMVGDPQQSIYGNRADLPTYLRIHENLVASGSADELVFRVTFRCDERIVGEVNRFFPRVLTGEGSPRRQVRFVPLEARPGAGPGQVVRIPLEPPPGFDPGRNRTWAVRVCAEEFARWFTGLDGTLLGASDPSRIAIICPRKKWIDALDRELKRRGIAIQTQSHNEKLGENPAYAWLSALLTVMAEPENAFELAGVLREIYGVSDHELARFYEYWNKNRLRFPATQHAFQLIQPVRNRGPVTAALNELTRIRLEIQGKSLRDAVNYLADAAKLRERLAALPDYTQEDTTSALDQLLAQAPAAESERCSLAEWAESLVERFDREGKESTPLPGHVQLLTVHKAKGLEWDAVLLPYLSCPFSYARPSYPEIYQPGSSSPSVVIIDKLHDIPGRKSAIELIERQERERLLYVAATRARRTLVLFDDSAFFPKPEASFAHALGILDEGGNRDSWKVLPSDFLPEITEIKPKTETEPLLPQTRPYDPSIKEKVRTKLELFPRRILPSSLSEETLPERTEPESALGHEFPDEAPVVDAAAYGNWWHDMMEHNPWHENPDAWKSHFNAQLEICPHPERGQLEIERFIASELAWRLSQPGWAAHTEAPVLWQSDPATVYEGIIDLACWHADEGNWLIVDWKTDRAGNNGGLPDMLKNRYASQVAIYARALRAIFRKPVAASLYSTVLGNVIPLC